MTQEQSATPMAEVIGLIGMLGHGRHLYRTLYGRIYFEDSIARVRVPLYQMLSQDAMFEFLSRYGFGSVR